MNKKSYSELKTKIDDIFIKNEKIYKYEHDILLLDSIIELIKRREDPLIKDRYKIDTLDDLIFHLENYKKARIEQLNKIEEENNNTSIF